MQPVSGPAKAPLSPSLTFFQIFRCIRAPKKRLQSPDLNSISYLFSSCLNPRPAPHLLQLTQILIRRWILRFITVDAIQSPAGALGTLTLHQLYLRWISDHISMHKSEKDFISFIKAVNSVIKTRQSLCYLTEQINFFLLLSLRSPPIGRSTRMPHMDQAWEPSCDSS